MVQQTLSGSLEENVLTALCYHQTLATTIAMKVTPELFQSRSFRTIAKAAIDYIGKFSEPPRNHLPDLLEKELNNGSDQILWKEIGRMEQIETELQADYVLAELDTWIDNHSWYNTLKEAMILNEKGDTAKSRELVFTNKSQVESSPGSWLNETSLDFIEFQIDDEFSLGIKDLDIRGVRPARKTILMCIAPKGRGKSMFLVHCGVQAALIERHNVLHITLEMSEEQTMKRYVQAIGGFSTSEKTITGIPLFKKDEYGFSTEFSSVTPNVLDHDSRALAVGKLRNLTRGKRHLLVKEFPTGALTTARLNMYLEALKRSEKWEPDLLIVDYAGLMHMNPLNIRTEMGRIVRELRGIAVERNLAVVTAHQGNRESQKARIVSAVHLAEDWSVAGTCDVLVTLCQTPNEKAIRLMRMYVAKARNVQDGYQVMVSQNYDMCQFCRDSVYMDKIVSAELDRMTQEDDED